MTNDDLIKKAVSIINSRKDGDCTTGNHACALLTKDGKIYTGANIDITSWMWFCAEHNAIGAMITAKEYIIQKIVTVKKDENGSVFIAVPCWRCRQFIYKTNKKNMENTEIILSKDKSVSLKELLPYYDRIYKLEK